MTDDEAIDEAIRRTGVGRYRHLCSDANAMPPPNDPATWRRFVREIARPAHPSLATRAGNLAGAVVRTVAAATSGQSVFAPAEEQSRRLTICRDCENFDVGRCRLCGCNLALKVWLKTEHCPLEPPKW